MLLDPDVGDDELRGPTAVNGAEAQLREDQSDLANWDARRPEGPLSSRQPSGTPG
ncbi:MAG: hypothetical protein OXG35_27505 [Acidobacteria bacterium]|nr:hypothetical protein [Acidobacteriota bacterium]